MLAHHIHHALAQVQELQARILEKQRFKGYSGRARALSGTLALLGAIAMGSSTYPATTTAHLAGWGAVFVIAFLLNYGALMYWFLFDPGVNRDWRRLKPVADVAPPLVVGGVFTLALVLREHHDYLVGTWMCLFGLANLASRHVLPRAICWVGLFYLLTGAGCLLWPNLTFINPWPMGLIFFIGEWTGGLILHFDGTRK